MNQMSLLALPAMLVGLLVAGCDASDCATQPDTLPDTAPTDTTNADATEGSDGADVPAETEEEASCPDPPPSRVSLPTDDSVHSSPLEWWYWTGHLQDESGNWYGFQWSFIYVFDVGGGIPVTSVNFAVTDVAGDSFHFTADGVVARPPWLHDGFNLVIGDIAARGGGGHDVLRGTVDGIILSIIADAVQEPTMQYSVGFVEYPFGGNTFYYSRERMAVVGTLTTGTSTHDVAGEAWFDHQWGAQSDAVGVKGWTWLGVQLDDGRELMLFDLRDTTGATMFSGGTISDDVCGTTELLADDFTITPEGTWTSPANPACVYPAAVSVTFGGETLSVRPVVDDQELRLPDPAAPYWEGAAVVTGDATGRAYLELTGYCP